MRSPEKKRLLIVGNRGGTNIGDSFLRAAPKLGFEAALLETSMAMQAPALIRRFNWWFRDRRPTRLGRFGNRAVELVKEFRSSWLVATGTVPLTSEVLELIGRLGVTRVNYLTDDPWNPAHRASWFLKALPAYDYIFSPRRANIDDLVRLGCSRVAYLPFGYDEEIFQPDTTAIAAKSREAAADVVFAGGADSDRLPYVSALIENGFNVALYGDYWERSPQTRNHARGHADPEALKHIIASSSIALCLVRHANRDGHAMRTFEVPAVGACMLVEDTIEHRELFGGDREAVVYFRNIDEMVHGARWLLENPHERRRLAEVSHQLMVRGGNTYRDRLHFMLEAV